MDAEKFRKIYLKRFSSKNEINEDEYVALDFFWRQHIAQVGTDYRLGRANRDKVYYEMAYGFILDCDLACEWYLDQGRKILQYSFAKDKEKHEYSNWIEETMITLSNELKLMTEFINSNQGD